MTIRAVTRRPIRSSSRRIRLAAVALSIFASLAGPSRSALAELTFEVVKSFELPDAGASALTLGSDGALYGTTGGGGTANRGTIFQVETDGRFERLHSFDGNEGWGGSGLVVGGDGALYGTSPGGSFGRGVVFRVDHDGNFAVVHSFSGPDGESPASNLVLTRDGALYGTTVRGGSFDRGTVFRIDRAGNFTSLRSFDIPVDVPYLVLGGDGALYGVNSGGYYGYTQLTWYRASIFRIEGDGTIVPIHTFDDGDWISNRVATGTDGSLYGATLYGDTCCGRTRPNAGSLFKIDSVGTFSVLHTFDYDAWEVGGPLFVGSDGALYGTTTLGDIQAHSRGTLFKIDPSGHFTTLYSSETELGSGPLVLGSDGSIYGTAYRQPYYTVFKLDQQGTFTWLSTLPGAPRPVLVLGGDGALYGSTDGGVVFRVDNAGIISIVHTFGPPDGFSPQPILAVGNDGAVYGATFSGGALNAGTLFKVDRAGVYTRLHDFTSDDFPSSDPPYYFPPRKRLSALTRGGDGAVYGITPYGGDAGAGQVFRVDGAGTFASVHSLQGGPATYSRSDFPITSLVLGGDGALYGSGYEVFKIDRAGVFTPLIAPFDSERCRDFGQYPGDSYSGPVALGRDGALYGINTLFCSFGLGGTYQYDNLFRADSEGNLSFLHSFTNDWSSPTSLTLGSDGALYGTRTGSPGSIFRIDSSGEVTTVHSFPEDGPGPSPFVPLVLGGGGALYGATSTTIFRIDAAANFETVHFFSAADGGYVTAPLVLANNGSIYGTTSLGGASNAGTVFEIDSAGAFHSVYSYNLGRVAQTESHFVVAGEDCALYGVANGGPAGGGILYRLFEPRHLCQQIHFDPLPDRTLGAPPFLVDAAASSGLPVSLSASGRCRLSGDQVFLIRGVGVCRVTAFQSGDSLFEPAEPVTREFRVRPPRNN